MQKATLHKISSRYENLTKTNLSKNKVLNVDINTLLNRVKINKKNEAKKKIIFFSFGVLFLSFTGIILSIVK